MTETKTEPAAQAASTTAAATPAMPLDRVVAATERRQSIAAEAAACLGVTPDKVCNLLRNVWKPSKDQPPFTDQEMFVGLSMIARFELDPVAKEVYVTRIKGRLVTIVGIDGWIKILDRTDHYDGFDQELIRDESGTITGCVTTIYSTKRSHPARYEAFQEEYGNVSKDVAKTLPIHMLRVFSLRHAARLFVPLGGVTTEEEAAYMAGVGNQRTEPSLTESLAAGADAKEAATAEPDRGMVTPEGVRLTVPKIPTKPEPPQTEELAPDAPREHPASALFSGDEIDDAIDAYRQWYEDTKHIKDPPQRLAAIDQLDAKAKADPMVTGKPAQATIKKFSMEVRRR